MSEQLLARVVLALTPGSDAMHGNHRPVPWSVCWGLPKSTDISPENSLPLQLSLSQLAASPQSLASQRSFKPPPQPLDGSQSPEGPQLQAVSAPPRSFPPSLPIQAHHPVMGREFNVWLVRRQGPWGFLPDVGCGMGWEGGDTWLPTSHIYPHTVSETVRSMMSPSSAWRLFGASVSAALAAHSICGS